LIPRRHEAREFQAGGYCVQCGGAIVAIYVTFIHLMEARWFKATLNQPGKE
jgi:hypothetical protein